MQPSQSTPGVGSSGTDRAKHAMQVTAILHIVSGSLSAALGAAAIGVRAGFAYLAVPIWSGLFFFLVTGILGLFTYRRGRVNNCMVGAYLGMGIMSLLAALNIVVLIIIAAVWEWDGCYPLTFYLLYPCNTFSWVRKFLDALIIVVAGFEAAVSIASISAAGCRTPCCLSCCRECCNSNDKRHVQSVTSGNAHNGPVYFTVQEGQSVNHPGGLQTQSVGAGGGQLILMQSQSNAQTGVPQTGHTAPVLYQPQHAVPPAVYVSPPAVTARTGSPANALQSGISNTKQREAEAKANSAPPPTKMSDEYMNEIGAVGGNFSDGAESDWMNPRGPYKDKTALLDK